MIKIFSRYSNRASFSIALLKSNNYFNFIRNSNLNLNFNKLYSSTPPSSPIINEKIIKSKLTQAFPTASKILVEDISGGCGAMFEIHVEANSFKGLNTVKQHQLINKALSDEIKLMHGIRITTSVPDS